MGIGPWARGVLGPLELPVSKLYRSYFVDLAELAAQVRSAGPAQSILEVGCGEGALAEELAARFPASAITGIDLSPRVGRLYRGDRQRVVFEQATVAQRAEGHPGAHDLIVLADVLHHVPRQDRHELLLGIRRALRPGGLFVLKDWEPTFGVAHALAWFSDRFVTGDRVHFDGAAAVRALAEGVFGPGCVERDSRVGPRSNNFVLFIRDRSAAPGAPSP